MLKILHEYFPSHYFYMTIINYPIKSVEKEARKLPRAGALILVLTCSAVMLPAAVSLLSGCPWVIMMDDLAFSAINLSRKHNLPANVYQRSGCDSLPSVFLSALKVVSLRRIQFRMTEASSTPQMDNWRKSGKYQGLGHAIEWLMFYMKLPPVSAINSGISFSTRERQSK